MSLNGDLRPILSVLSCSALTLARQVPGQPDRSYAYDPTCRWKYSLTLHEAARSSRRSPLLTYPSLDHLQVGLFDPVEYFDVAPRVVALTGPNHE